MNASLFRALVPLLPACVLFCGSMVMLHKRETASRILQVLGSGGLVVVSLTHVCEAVSLFPWMGWGLANSPGHYLDLSSAVVGFTLFPIGYLIHSIHQNP